MQGLEGAWLTGGTGFSRDPNLGGFGLGWDPGGRRGRSRMGVVLNGSALTLADASGRDMPAGWILWVCRRHIAMPVNVERASATALCGVFQFRLNPADPHRPMPTSMLQ